MFIIDALIGNTDRHNKNWGVLYDKKKDEYCFAPIYDCGSSIFPTLSDEGITELFESETVFRNSVLNVYSCLRENGKRINYYQYFKACSCRDFIDALKRVVPKININEIGDIIMQIPYLSNARKDFYFKFLQYRYWEILIPAYKKVLKNVL